MHISGRAFLAGILASITGAMIYNTPSGIPLELPFMVALVMTMLVWTVVRNQFDAAWWQWRLVLTSLLLMYPLVVYFVRWEVFSRLWGMSHQWWNHPRALDLWMFLHWDRTVGMIVGTISGILWMNILYPPDFLSYSDPTAAHPDYYLPRKDRKHLWWLGSTLTLASALAGVCFTRPFYGSGETTGNWYNIWLVPDWLMWTCLWVACGQLVSIRWYISKLKREIGDDLWYATFIAFFLPMFIGAGYIWFLMHFWTYFSLVLVGGLICLLALSATGGVWWIWFVVCQPLNLKALSELRARGALLFSRWWRPPKDDDIIH